MKRRYGSNFPPLDTLFSGAMLCAAAILAVAIVLGPTVLAALI